MASQAGASERGRPTDVDWEERERSSSPTNAIIRGGAGDLVPKGVSLPAEAYAQASSPVGLLADAPEELRLRWEEHWEEIECKGLGMRNFILPEENENANFNKYVSGYTMPKRPVPLNHTGKEVNILINMHEIASFPSKPVHQFDIVITGGDGPQKRGLIRALWESNAVQSRLGDGWIWNGDKIAWSDKGLPECLRNKIPAEKHSISFEVDLDAERGRPQLLAQQAQAASTTKKVRVNKFRVQIRWTKTVNLAAVWGYLNGQMDWNDSVTEAITLLNHVIRETPAKNLTAIKNSFFPKNSPGKYDLGGGIYALKGAFQSIRMADKAKLMLNVDVSHACFYNPRRVDQLAMQIVETQMPSLLSLVQKAQQNPPHGKYTDSATLKKLQTYLRKLAFRVDYPKASDKTKNRRWVIKGISYFNARTWKLEHRQRDTGIIKKYTVEEYFREIYGVRLEHPALPLIECTKKDVYYPMELCVIEDGQRYPFKLNERQTSDMIRFAVSRPADRMKSIQQGLSNLDWKNDKVLQHYGIRINPAQMTTKARLLDPPRVMFRDNKSETPGYAGRWRIDGKKFHKANTKPLKNWGVCIITGGNSRDAVTDQEALAFVKQMVSLYKGYGGAVINPAPTTCRAPETDTAKAVDMLYSRMRANGLGAKEYADLMIFILPRKNTEQYQRLKRCADLKWGSVSQCMQAAHVKRNSDQYIGNVLMKINAKLGGSSFKAYPIISTKLNTKDGRYFKVPTMIIGADVSHPGPGSLGSSMAALTVSMDRDTIRYGAAVQSNGHRLEMITTWNWNDMLGPLAREWIQNPVIGNGSLPHHVYYFRDGVSEGQYEHVIQQEVRDMRNVFKNLDGTASKEHVARMKFTVIVASKRHHVRFFPKPGPGADKNGNPHPGSLVESDVTTAKGYDFYLCSHSAIQGTARPTHYAVIMDQINCGAAYLQNMIYEHCYQYMRSSTPVSLYPAVYYAHLASRRAVAHERTGQTYAAHRSSEQKERYMLLRARAEADMTGKVMTEEALARLKTYTTNEYPPCIPTCNPALWFGMWYI